MMKDEFEITYEIYDGYVGGSAPHTVKVHASDIDADTESEAHQILQEIIEDDANAKGFGPVCKNDGDFVSWVMALPK